MKRRSNGELLQAVRELVSRVRGVTRELLVELGELDARRLYLEEACPSMFAFCTTRLGFSEDVAYKRIQAARLGRRFPALLEAFGAGRIHLAGLAILGPHLTAANHRELLAAAAGLTKRQIESLVADRFASAAMARPKATLRRLLVPVADGHKRVSCSKRTGCGRGPGSRDGAAADSGAGGCGGRARISQEAGPGGAGGRPRVGLQPGTQAAGIAAAEASAELAPGRVAVGPTGERRPRASAAQALPASKAVTSPPGERPTAPDVEPPSPGAEPRAASAIYRLSLTVGKEFAEKLETARAHLSHSIPDGDLARILELGLDALLADKRRSRCAERVQDRKLTKPSRGGQRSADY